MRRLRKAAAGLPEFEEGSWYATPALKVRGKGFCRIKDAGTIVLMCPLEDKQMLTEAAPEVFFETDHYKGWAALLARIDAISDEELAHRLRVAWLQKAPRSLAKGLTGAT